MGSFTTSKDTHALKMNKRALNLVLNSEILKMTNGSNLGARSTTRAVDLGKTLSWRDIKLPGQPFTALHHHLPMESRSIFCRILRLRSPKLFRGLPKPIFQSMRQVPSLLPRLRVYLLQSTTFSFPARPRSLWKVAFRKLLGV